MLFSINWHHSLSCIHEVNHTFEVFVLDSIKLKRVVFFIFLKKLCKLWTAGGQDHSVHL